MSDVERRELLTSTDADPGPGDPSWHCPRAVVPVGTYVLPLGTGGKRECVNE